MDKNIKVVLPAVALAALMAAPAVAKPRTPPHPAAATQVHRNTAVVRDYVTGEVLGADPDPRVRYELKRDGGSSWDEGKE
jgi:D-alanyl-D-alanine carboxypeptidase